MRTKLHSIVYWLVFSVAAIVLGLTVAQAVRDDSLAPIWTIGWLPAVFVASVTRPVSVERCRSRLRRRPQSPG